MDRGSGVRDVAAAARTRAGGGGGWRCRRRDRPSISRAHHLDAPTTGSTIGGISRDLHHHTLSAAWEVRLRHLPGNTTHRGVASSSSGSCVAFATTRVCASSSARDAPPPLGDLARTRGRGEGEGFSSGDPRRKPEKPEKPEMRTDVIPLPAARGLLLLVPVLWATYNPALRFIYEASEPPTPAELTSVRSLISLVPFAPILLAVARDAAGAAGSGGDGGWVGSGGGASTVGSHATGASAERSRGDGSSRRVRRLARAGVELGLLNWAGTAAQAWGLEQTTATRAGFLLSTINVMVPVGAALQGHRVPAVTWAACALALAGVVVISEIHVPMVHLPGGLGAAGVDVGRMTGSAADVGVDGLTGQLNGGDGVVLVAAVLYSAFTIRLGTYARELNAADLSAVKSLVMAVLCVGWVIVETASRASGGEGGGEAWTSVLWSTQGAGFAALWGAVIYSAIAPGALANFIQTLGQSAVPAAEAQVIFATTPVFNAAISVAFLGETVGYHTVVGGGVILGASLLPSAIDWINYVLAKRRGREGGDGGGRGELETSLNASSSSVTAHPGSSTSGEEEVALLGLGEQSRRDTPVGQSVDD